uniref:START domain-containing protein n=1 Tax=Ditylenchus dipsaci TaxID=166011 RepID=A0A915E4I4_9BILA
MTSYSVEVHGVVDQLTPENEKYSTCLKQIADAFDQAYSIFTCPDFESRAGWSVETKQSDAVVHSIFLKEGRKLFCVKGELACSMEKAVEDNWLGLDGVSKWNQNIDFSKRLFELTENVDVVHYGNAPVLFVSGRDYVVGRMSRRIKESHYVVAHSIEGPDLPVAKDRVRGTIHLGGGRYSQHPTDPNKTIIDFIICLDLGGMFPASILNSMMGRLFLKEFNENKKRSKVLCSSTINNVSI